MKTIHHIYTNGVELDEEEFDVGEIIWYIFGSLVVKCTITELDDYFRKKNPDAYLFYELDEPIGHSVGADDLFCSLDELKGVLDIEDFNSKLRKDSLEEVRNGAVLFIARTHAGDFGLNEKFTDGEIRAKVPEVFDYFKGFLKEKVYGTDWFYLKDLLDEVKNESD